MCDSFFSLQILSFSDIFTLLFQEIAPEYSGVLHGTLFNSPSIDTGFEFVKHR